MKIMENLKNENIDSESENFPIVLLKEAWEESGYLYMCSEFCELGNLNDYISKSNHSVVEIPNDSAE